MVKDASHLKILTVVSRMGAVAYRPISHPRSSNRTCGATASGFPTGFTPKHTAGSIFQRPWQHSPKDASRVHHIPLRLRLRIKLSLESPKLSGICRLIANHLFSSPSKARQKQGSFPPPALPGITGNMTLSDSRLNQHTIVSLRIATPYPGRVSHGTQATFLTCCPHYPGGSK